MKQDAITLLVMDDEPLICSFIKTVGEQMGFTVTSTSEPDEFRSSYLTQQPEIVILDLQMPKVDGIEMLRFLADNDCESSILLASGVDMKTLASAENLGIAKGLDMCGVLQKPIRVETLKKALERGLKNRRKISRDTLLEAIRVRELEVYFQPIASHGKDGEWTITGAEALVRWQHPQHGMIMPQEFIGLAEETDLIMPLTDYVLRQSIKERARWQMAGHEIMVSVNLSPTLLTKEEFPEYVDRVFSDHGADRSDFVLELTEGAATRDIELTIDI